MPTILIKEKSGEQQYITISTFDLLNQLTKKEMLEIFWMIFEDNESELKKEILKRSE